MDLETALDRCPLVAILRGVGVDEARGVGEALYAAGVRVVQVPLGAPGALDSITALADRLGERALIGAGDVFSRADVDRAVAAGARLLSSPHCDPALIAAVRARGLYTLPGIFTPTEAFLALQAGASALALTPARSSSPQALAAMMSTLPPDTRVLPTGGVTPDRMGHWWAAGARGFGLGGTLYAPGRAPTEVARRARACIHALDGSPART